MKKIFVIGVLISLVAVTGCYYLGPCLDGSGPVSTDIRDISNFTGVSNTADFNVYVKQSDHFGVEVVAQESLLPLIETYVSNYTLIIKTANDECYRSNAPVEVHVSLPELDILRLSGSGRVIADVAESRFFECSNTGSGYMGIDSIYAESISLSNSGSGTVEVEECYANEISMLQSGSGTIDGGLLIESVDVSIRHSSSGRVRTNILGGTLVDAILSGSGKIELSGDAKVAEFTLNASGKVDALELAVSDVSATTTGSGNSFVWAIDFLEATITGSGDIIYRGNPFISYKITGSGKLRPY